MGEPIDWTKLNLSVLEKGTKLHRIHPDRYHPTQFNDSGLGDTRFSPIKDQNGKIVPTIYAATTFDGAAMETTFHEVPSPEEPSSLNTITFQDTSHSVITTATDLIVVDLTTKSLRNVRLNRKDVIDTDADKYPITRGYAEAILAQVPEAQGLRWVSKQDDSAYAYMLFGTRVDDSTLVGVAGPNNLVGDTTTFDAIVDLAERIGVDIIDPKRGNI